ncbi:unnamed protein product [Mytilus coruscus]|uniref:C-type lectin domain-containing protein n=1 Tax=Mytilus coruscus TaxID=42192 RepID=A0A6J8A6E3_MYTCO|nr:unnamed protein product [Mytilus coruscus]
MGGVDRNDQMCHLPKSAKQYKWYMRLAEKAVLWAAYNAYILEGHVVNHKPPRKRPGDFQQFIDELVHALVGEHRAERILIRRANVENETPERLINFGAACKKLDSDLYWQTHSYESFWLSQVIRMKVKLSTFFLWTNGEKQSGQWGWGTGKPAFKETRWLVGQPNEEGNCITIYTVNGFLDDKPCEKKYNYVCKTKQ